jgi:predicted nucleotidyltransferase component of viral defense system
MNRNNPYYKQVQLLLQVIPFISEQPQFALKGGTAINLFLRDFPRLSVDIDLVYLPHEKREIALNNIQLSLNNIAKELLKVYPQLGITKSYENKDDSLRLIVSQSGISIKIELSPVLRETVFPPTIRQTTEKVELEFGFAEINVVALEDLYAGKLCAAFDRQHPRDFFDVMVLLENEGITDGIRQAFLVYLTSHARPMNELLTPNWKSIEAIFLSEFQGMAFRESSVIELENTSKTALKQLLTGFTTEEKLFLCSIYSEAPRWDLLPFEHIQHLPAVKWKLLNIRKMDKQKRLQAHKALETALT